MTSTPTHQQEASWLGLETFLCSTDPSPIWRNQLKMSSLISNPRPDPAAQVGLDTIWTLGWPYSWYSPCLCRRVLGLQV